MSTTATHTTGKPQLLAVYDSDEGERKLIGQRVDGTVRITDRRPGGPTYLVEGDIHTMAELQAIVTDYLAKAKRLGYAPMQGWF